MPSPKWRQSLGIGVWALAIGLGWQIVQSNLTERLPPELAVRVAPGSAGALARAAEAALGDDRVADAESLSRASLQIAPFNVRALRVLGLARARSGATAQADQLITLAGNWSLRDDPSHAWLIEQRLKQGNYASAFSHADTLLRRREDTRDQLFKLYTEAAKLDQRAWSPLTRLLSEPPPWRSDYLRSLLTASEADALVLNLALSLEKSPHPLSEGDLQGIYENWIGENRYDAIRYLRTRLAPGALLTNGDFEQEQSAQRLPFDWEIPLSGGLSSEIRPDEAGPSNLALRVSHDGYTGGPAARQMLALSPGVYRLSARYRGSTSTQTQPPFTLSLYCAGSRQLIGRVGESQTTGDGEWKAVQGEIVAPPTACAAQWLLIEPAGAEGPSRSVFWVDDVAIERR